MLALELAQQLEHRGGLQLMLPSAASQLSQRATDADDRHGLILRLWVAPKLIGTQQQTLATANVPAVKHDVQTALASSCGCESPTARGRGH
jgi:hypothetical protein